MLLFGDTDFLMHIEVGHEMHTMITTSLLKVIVGGTHRMHYLYPNEFAKTVLTFFDDMPKLPEKEK